MSYNGMLRNIGLFASETSHFRNTSWAERLDLMDDVWVINQQQVEACANSGVVKIPRVIPHATETDKFQQSYEPLEPLQRLRDDGDFIFYFIGEHVRRKNLMAFVKAFHLEFHTDENVQLLIKTSVPGMDAHRAANKVRDDLAKIKNAMKLPFYKDELLITERYTEHAMGRLHASCDCFVMPSHGEAWCIPAFDAMGFGKTPIVTNCTGMRDFVNDENGWLVNCRPEPCMGATDTFSDLYVANEDWWSIDINHLRSCMRTAFEERALKEEKALNGIRDAHNYSYEAVGAIMRDALLK